MNSPVLKEGKIVEVEECQSTQESARTLCAKETSLNHLHWVRSKVQSSGRGRQGRVWESASKDNLYVSCAFNLEVKPQHVPLLPLIAGKSMMEVLGQIMIPDLMKNVGLKWPNDVVLRTFPHLKLGGILAEAFAKNVFVVGWGLNVGDSPLETSTSIKALTGKEFDSESKKVIFSLLRSVFLQQLNDWLSDEETYTRTLELELSTNHMSWMWGHRGSYLGKTTAEALCLGPLGTLKIRMCEGPEAGKIREISAGDFVLITK